MEITGYDRQKIEKILQGIQESHSNEIMIDNLIFGLRPYSNSAHAFRDIADMIAHPEPRNKGPANECINDFHRHLRYLSEYTNKNRPLELSEPFPIYIKKILIRKIKSSSPEYIKKKYNDSQEAIISRLTNIIVEDKPTKTARLHKKPSVPTHKLIAELLETLVVKPPYIQKDFIQGMLRILDSQGFGKYIPAIELKSNEITACVLATFHSKKHQIDVYEDIVEGTCEIATERDFYPIGLFLDENDNPVQIDTSLGMLGIRCAAPVKSVDGRLFTMASDIFETDLVAEEWCDTNIVRIGPPLAGPADMLIGFMDFNREIGISKNFKLTAI